MSSAGATYYDRKGEVIGYGVYFGTASLLESQVCDTPEAAWSVHDHARHPEIAQWQRNADCDHNRRIEGWVHSEYGSGRYWPVLICDQCRSVIAGWSDYGGEYGYDSPTVEEQYHDWLLDVIRDARLSPTKQQETP